MGLVLKEEYKRADELTWLADAFAHDHDPDDTHKVRVIETFTAPRGRLRGRVNCEVCGDAIIDLVRPGVWRVYARKDWAVLVRTDDGHTWSRVFCRSMLNGPIVVHYCRAFDRVLLPLPSDLTGPRRRPEDGWYDVDDADHLLSIL